MIESQFFSYGASLLTGSDNTLSENEERRKDFFLYIRQLCTVFSFFLKDLNFKDLE
jgi:hypothetical protein